MSGLGEWTFRAGALAAWFLVSSVANGQAANPEKKGRDGTEQGPPRVFADRRFSMDEILKRPYGPDVPMGCTGARLWATSPQGWAFGEGVHWIYITDLRALDLQVRDSQGLLLPEKATYYPSHVHMEGAKRAEVGSASFTFRPGNEQNPLSKPFAPEKRWTCWSSGHREDWYQVDFGASRTVESLKVYFFDDTGRGGCRPPSSLKVQRQADGQWADVKVEEQTPQEPAEGENLLKFSEPVQSARIRLVFRNAGDSFYTGLYGFEALDNQGQPPASPAVSLQISGDKFITPDDVLVSVLRVKNPTDKPRVVRVVPVPGWEGQQEFHLLSNREQGEDSAPAGAWSVSADWQTRRLGFDIRESLRFIAMSDPPEELEVNEKLKVILARSKGPAENAEWMNASMPFSYTVEPGGTRVFKAALEIKKADEPSAVEKVVNAPSAFSRSRSRDSDRLGTLPVAKQDVRDPLKDQVQAYQDWFDQNLAYFDCSDEFVRKMFYHRAYNLRKNMMDPKLGALKRPTQSEGRWRSGWYANVISYGAAHQIREARWLRDPKYWRGHLRTFVENEKPDHVYPRQVKPSGPTEGQYTDWISSTAWDGHLVHPSKPWLSEIIDKLADNTRGWQSVYDPDDDGLLLVDSHWWTGMEYQPSFFYFSDYKVSPDFHDPAKRVSLERVDLTSYNFGNAANVAKIYHLLGQGDKAKEFEALAEKIRKAVTSLMWRPEEKFFYSLKADDNAVADVKEVIGVYPFYFGLPPAGEGFEAAWTSILDPEQFWTPWPVASASKQCPAYSQDGWPGDTRRSGCMWNGPTWPHANSIVLTAMARTLRSDRELKSKVKDSTLTNEKLWELFLSFTKAQYRGQDINYPWTGEYYDGTDAHWKTRERDYNHSTWIDVLIPDILGLVPRSDEILEIDPLVPPEALSSFLLDGQAYHGHDISLVWDKPGDGDDRYGDGREGFDIYVDGKLAVSAKGLQRLEIDLKTGKPTDPGDVKPAPRQ